MRIEAGVLVAAIERLKLALVVLARNSQQEVREVRAGLASEEKKAAIELSDGIDVDLIVVKLAADFDGVGSDHFGKVVEPLKGVADLVQLVGIGSDREAVETDALDSFGLGRQRHDSRSSLAHFEALGGQADAHSADWFAEVIRIAHVAEVEFVHGGRAERFGVAQAEQLGAAEIKRVEARDIRPALSDRVRIVLRPVVEKVVGGHQSPAGVGVQPIRAFVVAQGFVEG